MVGVGFDHQTRDVLRIIMIQTYLLQPKDEASVQPTNLTFFWWLVPKMCDGKVNLFEIEHNSQISAVDCTVSSNP